MFQDVSIALHRQGQPHDIAEGSLEIGVEAKVNVREYDMDMLEADPRLIPLWNGRAENRSSPLACENGKNPFEER